MGYTHYWRRPEVLNTKTFAKFTEDCKKIIAAAEAAGIAHGDGGGDNTPVIEKDIIIFNGHNEQPIGMWTTSEDVGLVWPSDDAGYNQESADPIAPKIVGSWFAGTLAAQRTAPINPQTGKGSGSYETFCIEQIQKRYENEDEPLLLDCTKTNFRPYDLTVTACLIAFKHHFGSQVKVSTDGQEKDWIDGRILVFNTLGYGMDTDIFAEPTEIPAIPKKPQPWEGKPKKSVQEIAKEVKQAMKLQGVKVSARTDVKGTTSISIDILEGNEPVAIEGVKISGYNVNQYHYKTDGNLTEYGKGIIEAILKIILVYHWDASDSQSDYFHNAFYYHIHVGSWDKPYQVKQSAAKPIEPITSADYTIHDYSEKAVAVTGNTKPIKEILKSLGGRFNAHLKVGAGWIFAKTKEPAIRAALNL